MHDPHRNYENQKFSLEEENNQEDSLELKETINSLNESEEED